MSYMSHGSVTLPRLHRELQSKSCKKKSLIPTQAASVDVESDAMDADNVSTYDIDVTVAMNS